MTTIKTLLMTAAMMAVPAAAFAQSSATDAKDYAKDKAVETVTDNMTADDAIVAGTTMIKGGSKEDAAMAVVKNRVDGKIDSMTNGAVSMDDMSKDGMMDAGKAMAMDKAAGSATTYTDGVAGTAVMDTMSKDGMMDAGKTMAKDKMMEQVPSSATTYGSSPVIPKSTTYTTTTTAPSSAYTGGTTTSSNSSYVGGTYNGQAYQGTMALPGQSVSSSTGFSSPSYSTSTTTSTSASTLNCPAGTKDDGAGACMITGDWKP